MGLFSFIVGLFSFIVGLFSFMVGLSETEEEIDKQPAGAVFILCGSHFIYSRSLFM